MEKDPMDKFFYFIVGETTIKNEKPIDIEEFPKIRIFEDSLEAFNVFNSRIKFLIQENYFIFKKEFDGSKLLRFFEKDNNIKVLSLSMELKE